MPQKMYEKDVHVSECWTPSKGMSYCVHVWGKYLWLEVPIEEDQIMEVLEEIPQNTYIKPDFRRRDFFALCLLTPKQFKDITTYK